MSSEFNEKNYAIKMDKTIQSYKKDLSSLRTGRANASMLDMIKVDVYGQMMPINQLATVSVPEARLITIQVWDQANIKLVDAAVQKSDLGINPQIDGSVLRLRIPDLTEERRKNPTDDVASVIASANYNGEQIGHLEAMSYYTIIATAGHDTTSSSTAGGILALIENPNEFKKLKDNPSLMPMAIDETIRWVTPVKNFFRTATEDCVIGEKKIKKDDSIMLVYPSGNRDEEVFEDPFKFKVDRNPNRHLAFGFGAHLCLGKHLAKMEMEILYNELFKRIEKIELNGEPSWVKASFVSGLKSLPIKYKIK